MSVRRCSRLQRMLLLLFLCLCCCLLSRAAADTTSTNASTATTTQPPTTSNILTDRSYNSFAGSSSTRNMCALQYQDSVTLEWDVSEQHYSVNTVNNNNRHLKSNVRRRSENDDCDNAIQQQQRSWWLHLQQLLGGEGGSFEGYDYDDACLELELKKSVPAIPVVVSSKGVQAVAATRHLWITDDETDDDATNPRNTTTTTNVILPTETTTTTTTLHPSTIVARMCFCATRTAAGMDSSAVNHFYCPATFNYCRRGSSMGDGQYDPPTCLQTSHNVIYTRSLWPFLLLWYALLISLLCLTQRGRHAIHHVLNTMCCTCCCCCCCTMSSNSTSTNLNWWNRNVVAPFIMWNDPLSAEQHIRRYLDRHCERLEQRYQELVAQHEAALLQQQAEAGAGILDEETALPTELRLKTKLFHRSPVSPTAAAAATSRADCENDTTTTTEGGTNKSSNDNKENNNNTINDNDEMNNYNTSHSARNLEVDEDDDNNVLKSDEEEGQQSCSICFAQIQEGDRVGDLPCQHLFHVECLKGWLVRRNVCPLCLRANVASPRYPCRRDAAAGAEGTDDAASGTILTDAAVGSSHASVTGGGTAAASGVASIHPPASSLEENAGARMVATTVSSPSSVVPILPGDGDSPADSPSSPIMTISRLGTIIRNMSQESEEEQEERYNRELATFGSFPVDVDSAQPVLLLPAAAIVSPASSSSPSQSCTTPPTASAPASL